MIPLDLCFQVFGVNIAMLPASVVFMVTSVKMVLSSGDCKLTRSFSTIFIIEQ